MHLILGQASMWSSPLKPVRQYWNCLSCNTKHFILLPYTIAAVSSPILTLCSLCDVTDEVTKVLLGHQRFPSITSNRIQIKSRKRHHYEGNELVHGMVCSLTSLAQVMTWGSLTWIWYGASTLIFIITKQKVYYSTRLDNKTTMVSELLLCDCFLTQLWSKTKPRL